jgi:hypothetical protein
MWIIILTTLLVAFVSGLSIGAFVERGLWESALKRAHRRIEAHRQAAAKRRRFRVIDGGAPDDLPTPLQPTAPKPAAVWTQAA